MNNNTRNRTGDMQMLPALCQTAQGAGRLMMRVYNQAARNDNVLKTEIKDDHSPVTIADKIASRYIERKLRALAPHIPVVSEENATDVDTAHIPAYWAVDPLDGTKEFIGRTGGFAVKIALLRENEPVLAAVYAPAFDTLYYTGTNRPAVKKTGDTRVIMQTRPASAPARGWQKGALTTLFNKNHADPALYTRERLRLGGMGLDLPAQPYGEPSLPRNLQVADGKADIYLVTGKDATLRGSGGFIWDNATDWLLVRNAGGTMRSLLDGRELSFAQDARARMPGYVTFGDRSLARKIFP